jgi:hypothetical protein
MFASTYANTNKISEKSTELSQPAIFPPQDGKYPPLQGKIADKRYYAPKNVFSCQAYDFGKETYIAQDVLLEQMACVSFYNAVGDFQQAMVIFMPGIEEKNLDEKALQHAFEAFGIGILKTVDQAQGIKVLQEEMMSGNMFFAAISVEKTSVLKAANGRHMSSTRGYLVFQDKDKLVVLITQKVTPLNQQHTPEKHIDKLTNDVLEFKKTFKFGPIPTNI